MRGIASAVMGSSDDSAGQAVEDAVDVAALPGSAPPIAGRGRSMFALFAGVALLNTTMVAASTAATLLAAQVIGAAWSGLPNAASVLGTAVGALGSGVLIARWRSRRALLTVYSVGAVGGVVAFAGAAGQLMVLVVVGLGLLGMGNGGAMLSRYVAAELYPERPGTGLSVIVWAGTVGAVVGPAMLAPAAAAARHLRIPDLSGPIGVAALLVGGVLAVTAVLPRAAAAVGTARPGGLSWSMLRTAARRPVVLAALVSMVAAQLAMVGVMGTTGVRLQDLGQGLDIVGFVVGAHVLGMFALAPVSGRIADRWGGRVAVLAGICLLGLATATAVAAPAAHHTGLPVALFLLGYGWNLVMVGGSSLLAEDLPPAERTQLQGAVDALVWGSSAFAGLAAGQLYALGGYRTVAALAGLLAVTPIFLIARRPSPAPRE